MIHAHLERTAGPLPVVCIDPRVLFLNRQIQDGVSYLEGLRAEGVAKTNFMQCDERSIYVFEYLFTSPLKLIDVPVPSLRRSHNHTVVRHLIDLLVHSNETTASMELAASLEECDPILIKDAQASTELRVCQMIEAHTIIFGILGEVLNKGLSASLQRAAMHILSQTNLPDTCRPRLAYVGKDRLFSVIAETLSGRGLHRAAEIVLNQKGRSIW